MAKSKRKAHKVKEPCSPNGPRLNREKRQLRRFYEPLILMDVLGKVRKEHDVSKPFPYPDIFRLPIKDVRRQFLHDLSYMCDYKKGGDTVTAIGLQKTPQRYIFWVAANTSPNKKIIPFLKGLLERLQIVSRNENAVPNDDEEDEEDEEDTLIKMCIHFASKRIKDYCSLLRTLFEECTPYLERRKLDGCTSL